MDRRFLEFLGKFLLNTANGQRQVEDMSSWMGQGFSGFDGLTDNFRKVYGLHRPKDDAAHNAEAWEKASENFKTSFKEWRVLMNVVPKETYQALEEKYRTLEEKSADQEKTIRQLQKLLNAKAGPHAEAAQGFAELMEKQTQQFQDLMEGVGKAFEKDKK
jgi:uncharacterized coiled-coil protein SlyX